MKYFKYLVFLLVQEIIISLKIKKKGSFLFSNEAKLEISNNFYLCLTSNECDYNKIPNKDDFFSIHGFWDSSEFSLKKTYKEVCNDWYDKLISEKYEEVKKEVEDKKENIEEFKKRKIDERISNFNKNKILFKKRMFETFLIKIMKFSQTKIQKYFNLLRSVFEKSESTNPLWLIEYEFHKHKDEIIYPSFVTNENKIYFYTYINLFYYLQYEQILTKKDEKNPFYNKIEVTKENIINYFYNSNKENFVINCKYFSGHFILKSISFFYKEKLETKELKARDEGLSWDELKVDDESYFFNQLEESIIKVHFKDCGNDESLDIIVIKPNSALFNKMREDQKYRKDCKKTKDTEKTLQLHSHIESEVTKPLAYDLIREKFQIKQKKKKIKKRAD